MYNRYYPYRYNRSNQPPQHLTPTIPQLPCPPPKPPGHHKQKPPKKKFDFKCFKNDTCKSLNDVECFLNNFSQTLKYIKLIKLLK